MVSICAHLAEGRRAARLRSSSRREEAHSFFGHQACSRASSRRLLRRQGSFNGQAGRRRLCLGLWLVWLAAASLARAAGEGAFLDRWFTAQTNTQSWSADFTQTRSLKVLAQPLVAKGKVWVTTPGRFRWELGQPAQTIALRQPDQLLIIYPRLKRAEKYALDAVPPGPLKDALALLDASLPRDRAAVEGRFHLLSVAETNSTVQVRLQPKSAAARKFVSEILIGLWTNDFSMVSTELRFADGSSLRNDFTNTVLNRPLDPGLFEEKLPPGMTIVEPLRQ
jgi:outer membrane lipoprotein-sorting protein